MESGILEAYVMGLLSDSECQEVELKLSRFPALQKEKAEIEKAFYNYLLLFKKTPPKGSKEQLFTKFKNTK